VKNIKKNQSELLLDENSLSKNNWFSNFLDYFSIDLDAGWPDKFGDEFRKWRIENIPNKPKVLSLFSGGGGLDIAFHDMGFNIVQAVEIEKKFSTTLSINSLLHKRLEGMTVQCMDIRDYKPGNLNIDFIIGGPPCQSFSAAGARAAGVKGINDRKGTLFEEYVRILKELQPKGFLFENVYRVIGAQNGKAWEKIQKEFGKVGYKLYWKILDSADYGVPQFRERLIIVGCKKKQYLFPFPTHGPDSLNNNQYYSSGLAVSGLKNVKKKKDGLGGRHGHLLNDIPNGLNYSFYTGKRGHPKPIFAWRSKFSDYLYKADPAYPVRTIKAQGGQYTGPFSWENRVFSIEELKRLQTFPDDYEIHGKRLAVIKQLGNSVPPQFGRILALSILDQIFQIKLPLAIDYMPQGKKLGFRKRKAKLAKVYEKKSIEVIDNMIQRGAIHKNSDIFSVNGEQNITIDNNFKVNIHDDKKTEYKHIFYEFDNGNWLIRLDKKNNNIQYRIKINVDEFLSDIVKIKKIEMLSNDSSEDSILYLWKFLEYKINELVNIDGLVQFFGYYQYKNNSDFKLEFVNDSLLKKPFWKTIKNLTEGLCTREQIHVNDICEVYGISSNQFQKITTKLKNIGYEIRNQNTNSQIARNYYIIPYSFPTLNERSLQRLTTLTK
tara:strand:- start:33 stop:2012 length:1980 start_codon:yes stop_codon:yes gene_type:complete